MFIGLFGLNIKIYIKSFLIAVLFLLFFSNANAYNLNSLLFQYAQKADLSSQTKKESAGYLIVFTRADLDRMQIKSLSELINYIPFRRYDENASGLSETNYAPYQDNIFNSIIVYINDREIISPFNGNAFQLLGQMDTGYIDHVEVYLGMPSYELGINTATIVIKVYTKEGFRENATVMGGFCGSYGTNDEYAYQGKGDFDDISYFLYFDRKGLKRKKTTYENPAFGKDYTLSKNKNISDFYGDVRGKNFRAEVNAVYGKLDNFIGKSWEMTTDKDRANFYYIYGGVYYTSNDKTFKASLSYSGDVTDNTQISDSPLGLIYTKTPPYIYTYNKLRIKMHESLGDLKITKAFKSKNNMLLVGSRLRYKKFIFKKAVADDVIDIPTIDYNGENVVSGYAEEHFSVNEKNLLIGSFKLEKHIENGGIKNFSIYGGRIGYIFNNGVWMSKTSFSFNKFAITPYVLYYTKMLKEERLTPIKATGLFEEITYNHKRSKYSLRLMDIRFRKFIVFTAKEYVNTDRVFDFKGVSLRYIYTLNAFNKLILNGWYMKRTMGSSINNIFGGFVSVFNRLGKFDFFNSLSYRGIYDSKRPAFNLNSTVTYHASRNLTLYLKGNNLLNRAITTDYYRINPLNGKKTVLNDVSVFDRTVWLGLEYKF